MQTIWNRIEQQLDSPRPLVAPSFRAWFERFATRFENGELVYSEEFGAMVDMNEG